MIRTTLGVALCAWLITVAATHADEYLAAPMQPQPQPVPRIASPTGPAYSMGMPSPQRGPATQQQGWRGLLHAQPKPQDPGWTGYGFGGVPTYQWGYFGAHYRPVKVYHRGYYGHRLSYGYRRGY